MGNWYHTLSPRFGDIIEEVVERFVDPEVRMQDSKRMSYAHIAHLNSQHPRLLNQSNSSKPVQDKEINILA